MRYINMIKYYKVLQPSIIEKFDLKKEGIFYVEEKYDGSQFRFGIENGKKWFGSKAVDFSNMRPPDKMFQLAVDKATEALNIFEKTFGNNDIVFFGEFFSKQKHNTITYGRLPQNNLVLFDIFYNNKFLYPNEVINIAKIINLEPVRLIAAFNDFPNLNFVNNSIKLISSLGDATIEGIVIKNYNINIELNSQIRPLFYKFVNKEFKELNDKEWNKQHTPHNAFSDIEHLFNKEIIYRKAIQHLEDSGKATGEMKDIVELIDLVKKDIEEEYMEAIINILKSHYMGEIKAIAIRGLPEFYKEYLYKKTQDYFNQ